MCVCEGEGGYNRSSCHPTLGKVKFVVLLKKVLTFNHKTNDAIVSNIDHTFKKNCVLLIGGRG